jgi:ribonuclease P protein component
MPEGRDESFSSKNRLRNSNDFRRVFSRGRRIATPYFIVYSLPNQLTFPRLGIQVKAKIGAAPHRNYLKRIVREVFRRLKNDFRTPLDVIFIAQKEMKDLDYQRFEVEFRTALQKYLHEPAE